MPRHYNGERTVHDVGNLKEFCTSSIAETGHANHLDQEHVRRLAMTANYSCAFKKAGLKSQGATILNELTL
jgi:hypothetical protein